MTIIENIVFDLEGVLGFYENPNSFVMYQGVEELIKELSFDYNLFYLTNVMSISSDYFNEYVTKDLKLIGFVGGLGSNNYPYAKPNQKFYRQLITQYKINPEESIFVDDKKENIKSAKLLGFISLLNPDKGESLKQLLNITLSNELSQD